MCAADAEQVKRRRCAEQVQRLSGADVQVCRCAGVRRCAGVQEVFRCADAEVQKCRSAEVQKRDER